MRLSQIYFRSGRAPQNERKVPFKEIFPLKLNNYMSGMSKKTTDNRCLFEMMLLFACWQKTEYNSNKCSDLVSRFKQCYNTLRKTVKDEKISKKREIPTPGSKNLSTKQLSYILRQYPTV